jgi:hypothetical protein
VQNIRVKQKCRALHFLGGFCFKAANGQVVATYQIHYADGETLEVPAIAGRDTANWWFRPNENSEGLDVAWIGSNPTAAADGYKIRLLHAAWPNPRPDVPVETLDFISVLSPGAPFLVAITAE